MHYELALASMVSWGVGFILGAMATVGLMGLMS